MSHPRPYARPHLADDRNRVRCRRIGGHCVGKEFYRLPPSAAISFAMDLDRYVIVGARRSDRLGRGVRADAVKVPGIVFIKAATPKSYVDSVVVNAVL